MATLQRPGFTRHASTLASSPSVVEQQSVYILHVYSGLTLIHVDNMPPEAKKRCRHAPSCYKFLSRSRRDRHYASADPNEALCSDFGSSDSEAEDDSPHPSMIIQDAASHSSHHANESSVSSLDGTSSDESTTSDAHDLYNFDEDDVDHHAITTLDTMILDLEDWQGPTKAKEMHKFRMYLCSSTSANSNVT
jgi:hypothetical protein